VKWTREPEFRRGDSNDDGRINIGDPIASLDFQFSGTFAPACMDALDFDDNGQIAISDPIGNLNFQFLGTAPPGSPGLECGTDPTEDGLGCQSSAACAGG